MKQRKERARVHGEKSVACTNRALQHNSKTRQQK
jgi:hypothetical protein